MTRKEQIIQAAKQAEKEDGFTQIVKGARGVNSAYGIGFLEGAEWADKHSIEVKEVNLENLFQALPEKIVDEKSHQVYELSIYHYDGQCVVDYVGEIDHDSLYTFCGNTLHEAIEKAWNWLRENSTGG